MKSIIKTPYDFNRLGKIIYNIVVLSVIGLGLSRNYFALWQNFDIYKHLSNFDMSILFVFCIGAISMLKTQSWKFILSLAAIMIAANFIMELFVPFANTRDVIDAYYGAAGVVLSVALLYLVKRVGLQATDTIKT